LFVGWIEESVVKDFPNFNILPHGIGSYAETWAIDSYTGSVGIYCIILNPMTGMQSK
jgi:hypothetical protein